MKFDSNPCALSHRSGPSWPLEANASRTAVLAAIIQLDLHAKSDTEAGNVWGLRSLSYASAILSALMTRRPGTWPE